MGSPVGRNSDELPDPNGYRLHRSRRIVAQVPTTHNSISAANAMTVSRLRGPLGTAARQSARAGPRARIEREGTEPVSAREPHEPRAMQRGPQRPAGRGHRVRKRAAHDRTCGHRRPQPQPCGIRGHERSRSDPPPGRRSAGRRSPASAHTWSGTTYQVARILILGGRRHLDDTAAPRRESRSTTECAPAHRHPVRMVESAANQLSAGRRTAEPEGRPHHDRLRADHQLETGGERHHVRDSAQSARTGRRVLAGDRYLDHAAGRTRSHRSLRSAHRRRRQRLGTGGDDHLSARRRSQHQDGPALSVAGHTVNWNKIGNVNSYVFVRKVPGQEVQYTPVTGTSDTPPVVPGATVSYGLRTAWKAARGLGRSRCLPGDRRRKPRTAPPAAQRQVHRHQRWRRIEYSPAKMILGAHITWNRVEANSETVPQSINDGFRHARDRRQPGRQHPAERGRPERVRPKSSLS